MTGERKPAGEWLDGAQDPGHKRLRQVLDENVGAGTEAETAIARQRVWNRVQLPWGARPPEGRRWGAQLLVATAAGGVVALVIMAASGVLWRGGGTTRVAEQPAPKPAGPQVVPLPSSTPATAFTTRAGQRARLRLARGVAVDLAPETALLPGNEQAAPEVQLGEVRFSVPPQGGRRYAVRAGAYSVTVLGTTFVVGVAGGAVNVSVESGVVEVEDASGRRLERLERGQRWSSTGEVAGPPEEPAPAPAPGRPAPATRRPAARNPVRAAAPSADPLLLQAQQARVSGNPRRALALYQQLADAGGPAAEIALFEMAAVQDRDLRDLPRALDTWQRQRSRHPGGLFRAETDLSIIEVLHRMGEERRTLDEALAFLQRYPRNERRGEVAFIAADLERRRGNCAAAVRLYDEAARHRLSGADADDAAFHRAGCLVALRDRRGPDAVRGYVARYPAGRHASEARRLLDSSARSAGER